MADITPETIPVAVHGFTWTTFLVGLLNLLVGGALVAWIRARPTMKKIETNAEERLRTDLFNELEKLRAETRTLTRKLDEERAQHDAVIAIMRHRLNNSDQCLDALLMLLEANPEKVREAVSMIKDMRTKQRETEATENAAFHAAKIARVSVELHD